MQVTRVDSAKKQNLKIGVVSALYGMSATGLCLTIKDISLKDVFSYKKLNSVQKNAIRASAIWGMIGALFVGILTKINLNKK